LNNPQIRVAAAAMSPFTDSNPVMDPSNPGSCMQSPQRTFGLPANVFVAAMAQERPDLFGRHPLIDFWDDHPYPMLANCMGTSTCTGPTEDLSTSMYQSEMVAANLPKYFPIELTEYGFNVLPAANFAIRQQLAANLIVDPTGTTGYLPQVWLKQSLINNVTGTMGFILPIPALGTASYTDSTGFFWFDTTQPTTTEVPYQTPFPIYTQVRSYRIQRGN
jgi:hypothetical protein